MRVRDKGGNDTAALREVERPFEAFGVLVRRNNEVRMCGDGFRGLTRVPTPRNDGEHEPSPPGVISVGFCDRTGFEAGS